MKSDSAQQQNLDQEAHDAKRAKMSKPEINLLAQRLAKLARSKGLSETSSSESDTKPPSSPKSE